MSHTFTDKDVKTRKPHKCYGCNREFPAGSTMHIFESVDAGEFYREYWCPVCLHILHMDYHYNDEVLPGDIKNNDIEYWEKIRARMEDKP